MAETLSIEICYAVPGKQELLRLKLDEGSTLQQALDASGLLEKYPEIDLKKNKFGIWNKLSKPDSVLRSERGSEATRC